jgi:hypothetical protein
VPKRMCTAFFGWAQTTQRGPPAVPSGGREHTVAGYSSGSYLVDRRVCKRMVPISGKRYIPLAARGTGNTEGRQRLPARQTGGTDVCTPYTMAGRDLRQSRYSTSPRVWLQTCNLCVSLPGVRSMQGLQEGTDGAQKQFLGRGVMPSDFLVRPGTKRCMCAPWISCRQIAYVCATKRRVRA